MLDLLNLVVANRKLVGIIAAILAVFVAGWMVNGWRWENKFTKALESQQEALVKQCDENKKITQEANDALQNKLSAIDKRLAASKLQPAKCVAITPSVAVNPSGGGEHAGQNGLSTIWLNEYAAECESYRSTVIVLDDFGRNHCK